MKFGLRQLWRRWPLLVPLRLFALFSNLFSDKEKLNLAQKLFSLEKPKFIKFGKPTFIEKVGVDTALYDLVTMESWWVFDCSKTDPGFLSLPVEEWRIDDQFRPGKEVCQDIEMNQLRSMMDKGTLNN